MPYIDRDARSLISNGDRPKTPGELNYAISQLVKGYIKLYGESYTNYNAVVGVLECLKLELYRRLVSPYEDIKLNENGDVF